LDARCFARSMRLLRYLIRLAIVLEHGSCERQRFHRDLKPRKHLRFSVDPSGPLPGTSDPAPFPVSLGLSPRPTERRSSFSPCYGRRRSLDRRGSLLRSIVGGALWRTGASDGRMALETRLNAVAIDPERRGPTAREALGVPLAGRPVENVFRGEGERRSPSSPAETVPDGWKAFWVRACAGADGCGLASVSRFLAKSRGNLMPQIIRVFVTSHATMGSTKLGPDETHSCGGPYEPFQSRSVRFRQRGRFSLDWAQGGGSIS